MTKLKHPSKELKKQWVDDFYNLWESDSVEQAKLRERQGMTYIHIEGKIMSYDEYVAMRLDSFKKNLINDDGN